MNVTSRILSLLLITATLLAATTGTAHAYIDVGTGTLLLQVMVAGFFGSLFALKVFWGRVTNSLSRLRSRFVARDTHL